MIAVSRDTHLTDALLQYFCSGHKVNTMGHKVNPFIPMSIFLLPETIRKGHFMAIYLFFFINPGTLQLAIKVNCLLST